MIVTLTGPNSYLIQQELVRIKKDFIDKFGDLSYERIDGEEDPIERIIEATQSLPFLSSKKLVVLRNPSSQKQFAEDIEQIINNTPETTDIVIVESKIDKRSVYFKVLKSKTEYKEFDQSELQNLNTWIVQYAKNHNGLISLADARYLTERVGQNQQILANEVDKLILYNTQINQDSIDLLTEQNPHSTIFELLDAAFAGNKKKVAKLYKEQREMKVEPQQIIAMLAWQLHILALVKSAGERSLDKISQESKVNPYVIRKTATLAKQISLKETRELINRALKLDVDLKSKNIDADEALKYFLLTVTS